jgi:hypothetical protein
MHRNCVISAMFFTWVKFTYSEKAYIILITGYGWEKDRI